MKNNTITYEKIIYRIRRRDPQHLGMWEANNTIGIFEFLTESNARKHIKEKNLNATVDKVKITKTEEITSL